ncbi:Sporulation and spore germination [Micromonospora nigra]|uniref:Sporulation and spore germination n=1 Tax=Micromonospora nigra TaxID=145857 RepID=A0A1C6R8U0_9ACTN|nr:GerMN domain-containing protein [Micromonospora nigra]SCL13506.1 Sporulation and spore germination [Micromonospora nigra]
MSRRAGAVVALAVVLAGCGVPAEDVPRAVTPPPGPFPYTATAAPTPETGRVVETLYLVRDARLVPVTRRVDSVPAAGALLRDLLAGPTASERDDGLTSALPGAVSAVGVEISGGLARVAVAPAGAEAGRSDEVLAYGQIVCTLTARADVDAVTFLRDGAALAVPRADGALSAQPLTAADYAELVSRR